MNLIFLDFDGVLNFTKDEPKEEFFLERRFHIDNENLNNLKVLTEKLNASIIISSTWRKDKAFIETRTDAKEIIEKFKELFLTYHWNDAPIIGITPNLSGFRGQEVAVFLDEFNGKVDNYIILDDDTDFLLTELKNLSPMKLDRLGIYSEEEMLNKSKNWSNQNLYQVNSKKGLTTEDINNLINNICIQDYRIKPYKTIL